MDDLMERAARNLIQTVLDCTLDLPLGEAALDDDTDRETKELPHLWNSFQSLAFRQAHQNLRSVDVLVNGQHVDVQGALVIARTLFELSADLTYIGEDVDRRLAAYFGHSGYTVRGHTPAETQTSLPNRRWKRLISICDELDSAGGRTNWRDGYESFYKWGSRASHAVFIARRASEVPQGQKPRPHVAVLLLAIGAFLTIAKVTLATPRTDAMHQLAQEYVSLAEEFFTPRYE